MCPHFRNLLELNYKMTTSSNIIHRPYPNFQKTSHLTLLTRTTSSYKHTSKTRLQPSKNSSMQQKIPHAL